MLEDKLKFVFNKFDHYSEFLSYEDLASGHINDTYLVKTRQKPYFIL